MFKFYENCNLVKEASLLMYRFYNQHDFLDLKESISKKSGYNQEIGDMIDLLQEIYEKIMRQVSLPDDLKVLFEPLYEQDNVLCIADSMIMTDYEMLMHKVDRKAIKKKFEEDNGRSFIDGLVNDFLDDPKENDQGIPLTVDELMDKLDQSEMRVKMKWEVLRVYHYYLETVDRLFDVMEPLIAIMEPLYREYAFHFQKFYDFWSRVCTQGTLKEALEHAVKLKIEDSNHITVVPSWMGCNAIAMQAMDAKADTPIVMYIGLFFRDSDFFFHSQKISREEMCSHLKLLSDPSKYAILCRVKDQARYGLQLAKHLNLTTATISHHVNALSNAGLLSLEKDANRVYYRMNKEHLGMLLDQLREDLLES